METKKYLRDLYRLPGFRARATLKPHLEDSNGCIITLDRRQKKQFVQLAAQRYPDFGIEGCTRCATWMLEQPTSILTLNTAGFAARTVSP